jgi:hypothetical protein
MKAQESQVAHHDHNKLIGRHEEAAEMVGHCEGDGGGTLAAVEKSGVRGRFWLSEAA